MFSITKLSQKQTLVCESNSEQKAASIIWSWQVSFLQLSEGQRGWSQAQLPTEGYQRRTWVLMPTWAAAQGLHALFHLENAECCSQLQKQHLHNYRKLSWKALLVFSSTKSVFQMIPQKLFTFPYKPGSPSYRLSPGTKQRGFWQRRCSTTSGWFTSKHFLLPHT